MQRFESHESEDDGTCEWPDRRNREVQCDEEDTEYESEGSEDEGDLVRGGAWNRGEAGTWTMHGRRGAGAGVDGDGAEQLFPQVLVPRRSSARRGANGVKVRHAPAATRTLGTSGALGRAGDGAHGRSGGGHGPSGEAHAEDENLHGKGRRRVQLPLNGNWTNAQLHAALAAHERGMSMNGAATAFNIPRSSLRAHLTGTVLSRKRGAAPVLTPNEEQQLVDYVIGMQDLGFPVTILQLKLKVALITQSRYTPFRNGIPGPGWLRWFRRRHPELSLRLAQGLDNNRARSLCLANVSTFYENLGALYDQHQYAPSHIWNCDESGVQAGRNGGAYVLAKTGSRSVHQVIPDEREWLTVLTCINAAGQSIPSFYIFRGKRFRRNYIQHCEEGSTMAMSNKAWMTAFLFSAWIDHFILALQKNSEISMSSPHLLIMDGHSSHITLDVVRRARTVGLHLLTLPSHCSHAMQPLDVSVFKPFKTAFRVYRDVWTLHNKGRAVRKEILASWVSKALRRALTSENIMAGFRTTGIHPLNPDAMASRMGPAGAYSEGGSDGQGSQVPDEDVLASDVAGISIEEVMQEPPDVSTEGNHYFVQVVESDSEEGAGQGRTEAGQGSVSSSQSSQETHICAGDGDEPGIGRFLVLPIVPIRSSSRAAAAPLIDYSKSIMLTSDNYLLSMEQLAFKRDEAAKAKEARKLNAQAKKRKNDEAKVERAAKKKQKDEERAAKAREATYWKEVATRGWGDDLQARLKFGLPPPPGSYVGVYCGNVPS